MDPDIFARDPDAPLLLRDLWESHAIWWQRGFTQGADAEYVEQILPLILERTAGYERVLDIGGGEGQVARAIRTQHGATTVVVDPSRNQVREARSRGGVSLVLSGEANALPIGSDTMDAAIACLVFEHVLELEGALNEIVRVLHPGGLFLFLLNHPILQTPGSGFIDDVELGERYWRLGPYLTPDISVEEVEKEVFIPFVHRPLSHYINAAIAAGLELIEMLEPAPPAGFLARAAEYQEAAAFPRLLLLSFRRKAITQ
ncbi:MAG: class I SAM-dependent methyltransferase [Ferrimicrobium sp.]